MFHAILFQLRASTAPVTAGQETMPVVGRDQRNTRLPDLLSQELVSILSIHHRNCA